MKHDNPADDTNSVYRRRYYVVTVGADAQAGAAGSR